MEKTDVKKMPMFFQGEDSSAHECLKPLKQIQGSTTNQEVSSN